MTASATERANTLPVKRARDAKVLGSRVAAEPWVAAAAALCAGFAILVVLYFPTVASAIHLWNTSSAYNYAYLILPISLGLIWSERRQLAATQPAPSLLGLALGFLASLMWVGGELAGINEARHIAFVGLLQALALAVLGLRLYRFLAFPLLYLFFLVPTGTFLLQPLQHISHAASAAMLRLSGVPIYTEGFLIQVPAGSFLVEPGCAGLNFFLVALALSLLYGRLTYRGLFARAVCVAVALGVSIIANIIRIYLIIGLAQATDRRIDITADHLLYGWGFFGVVMLVMMWLGTRIAAAPPVPRVAPAAGPERSRHAGFILAGFLIVVAFAPIWAANSRDSTALRMQLQTTIGRLGVPGLGPNADQGD